METILRLINGVAWERVIVALLHSLWQGAILAVVVWALLRSISASRARLRYGIAVAGLFAALVTTMATLQWLGESPIQHSAPVAVVADSISHNSNAVADVQSVATPQSAPVARATQRWTWAALFWLAGTIVMLGRAAWSLIGAGRLLRSCRFIEDEPLTTSVDQLKRTMGIARPVRLATGPAIHVPAVFGTFVPVILLPLAVMNEMPVAHLQMILAHELAHVRRHDYLINLLQLLIEALLFFNPAIWWLSRQIRIEREACCDAVAVAATGSGTDYVRSLAEVVGGIIGTQPGLQLTPAMQGGGIVDRVRRVLAPTWRPMVRLPWYSLIGTTAVAIVLLAGMWGGTHVAVRAAENLLNPAEQVEKMAKLQNEIALPAGVNAGESHVVSGTIRTEDGKPLPKQTQLIVLSQWANSSSIGPASYDKQGHFSVSAGGNVIISVQSPGYAPTFADPIHVGHDGKFPPVDLVLKLGFDQKLRLTDQIGQPVANAPVTVGIDGGNPSILQPEHFTTDAAGYFVMHHAPERTAFVTAEIHGFQYDQITTKLAPGTEPTIKLMAAIPTDGTVTDSVSGQPVADAKISLVQREGFNDQVWPPHADAVQPPLIATTDAQGKFILDTLRQGCSYTFWVSTKNQGSLLIREVREGQSGLNWTLGKPHSIAVTIHAPAGKMPKTITATSPYKFGDTEYDYGLTLPVKVKDGIGTAVLTDPLPVSVRFWVGDHEVKADADETGPVVLDLTDQPKPQVPQTMRTVVLNLDYPKDGAEPRGKVHIDAALPGANAYTPLQDAELKNGKAQISVATPSKLSISQGSVVGYWVVPQNEIQVQEGHDPLVVPVSVSLAGAIHGTVTDENDKPFANYFYVSLLTIQPSPEMSAQHQPETLQPFNGHDGSGRYLMSPVPLGGTYRVVACAGPRLALSDEIKLEPGNPIQQIDLKFASGVAVSGTVTAPNGEPVVSRKVQLDCFPVESNDVGVSTTTDREGKFVFEHVDAKAADYNLSVAPDADTQGFEAKHLAVSDTPLQIQLKPGLTAKGKIINVDTGKPIANVKVTLQPKNPGQAQYGLSIEAVTDQDGVFEARGLEEIEYNVPFMVSTIPPDCVILRDAAGKVTGIQWGNSKPPVIKGGQEGVTEIKRMVSPW